MANPYLPIERLIVTPSHRPQQPFIPEHPTYDPYGIDLHDLASLLSGTSIHRDSLSGSPHQQSPPTRHQDSSRHRPRPIIMHDLRRYPGSTIASNNPANLAATNSFSTISQAGSRSSSAPPMNPSSVRGNTTLPLRSASVAPRSASVVSAPRHSYVDNIGDEENDQNASLVLPVQPPWTHAPPNGTLDEMAAPRISAYNLSPNKTAFGSVMGRASLATPAHPAHFQGQFGPKNRKKSFTYNVSTSGTPITHSQVTRKLSPGSERAKPGDLYMHLIVYPRDSGRNDRISCWQVTHDEDGLPVWNNITRHYLRNDGLVNHPASEASSYLLHCRTDFTPNYISPMTFRKYKAQWEQTLSGSAPSSYQSGASVSGHDHRRSRSVSFSVPDSEDDDDNLEYMDVEPN
ncbi:hypothetical protein CVT24_007061 [Panaeolus cyanescens]|uniref:Uncharacterized protein n=1 Tax=Panaeolus cyanescens TaxID=181874 RepID=A0A409VJR5_9AGAR|nr:hypothetical protein CVT24_007061 [Panaeolus cyanescens]